jgi:hypothetical protein
MKTQTIHTTERANLATRRILLVANQSLEDATLRGVIGRLADGRARAEVLVVAPALNSRVRHWLSDEDEARRRAAHRLDESLERLRAAGIDAEGRIGDPDPLQAIGDALREFRAHEIVIATQGAGRSHWLTRDLVERARRHFAQPVVQAVVEKRQKPALVPPCAARSERGLSRNGAVARCARGAGT